MTAPAKSIAHPDRALGFWRAPMLESLPLRLSVLIICFLWTLPTAGLLVTSFRNPQLITKTGWWEGLFNLFDANQWTSATTRRSWGAKAWAPPSSTASS